MVRIAFDHPNVISLIRIIFDIKLKWSEVSSTSLHLSEYNPNFSSQIVLELENQLKTGDVTSIAIKCLKANMKQVWENISDWIEV